MHTALSGLDAFTDTIVAAGSVQAGWLSALSGPWTRRLHASGGPAHPPAASLQPSWAARP